MFKHRNGRPVLQKSKFSISLSLHNHFSKIPTTLNIFQMQRKLYIFCLAVALISFIPRTQAQRGKSEFTVGYGRFSSYQFYNRPPYSSSSGTFTLAYRYYVSSTVTIGMGFGNERINNWAGIATLSPEITVKYLDTRGSRVRVRLYGSAGYGVSFLTDLKVGPGQLDETGAKPWGLQVTPIGVRVGRQFAYFAELGFGYKGLVHGGVSWRFPKHWKQKEVDMESK